MKYQEVGSVLESFNIAAFVSCVVLIALATTSWGSSVGPLVLVVAVALAIPVSLKGLSSWLARGSAAALGVSLGAVLLGYLLVDGRVAFIASAGAGAVGLALAVLWIHRAVRTPA